MNFSIRYCILIIFMVLNLSEPGNCILIKCKEAFVRDINSGKSSKCSLKFRRGTSADFKVRFKCIVLTYFEPNHLACTGIIKNQPGIFKKVFHNKDCSFIGKQFLTNLLKQKIVMSATNSSRATEKAPPRGHQCLPLNKDPRNLIDGVKCFQYGPSNVPGFSASEPTNLW